MIQEPDDTTNDMFESFVSSDRLASPGMEHLIEEQMKENKKLKSNVKFNKAFDVAKVCAEYLSKYNTDTFKDNLEIFQAFTELMRTGLPDNVKDAILNSSSSSVNSSSAEDGSAKESCPSESPSQGSVLSPKDHQRIVLSELPEEHQVSESS